MLKELASPAPPLEVFVRLLGKPAACVTTAAFEDA
jgi:hypothetical protein